ncbi:MAG: SOS response-associated peptidase [Pirellulaceae bacterium]|nr:SOS response-associated peptidase [Pirellulaceae bacterium]
MCGRFTLRTPASEIAGHFALFEMPPFTARFNIAPTQPVAAIRLVGTGGEAREPAAEAPRELVLLRWGLVPGWAEGPAVGGRWINARAETAATKPAFRAAMRGRRCLIAADGFYEWRRDGRRRTPHFFRLGGDRLFAFAGLWEHWEGANHSALETCAILTTDANDVVRPVHDRMPVILAPDDYAAWLDPAADPKRLTSLCKPYPAEEMKVTAIGPYVNKPTNEGPQCIEPTRELFER